MTLIFEVNERRIYLGSVIAARNVELLAHCGVVFAVDCRGNTRGYRPPR